ncbi:MAG: methionyl-tRNA formyltransferase [Chloroflexi bacterium]|nr:methionyl-tRNA formyltransferase [Chloroflexota bacterium]
MASVVFFGTPEFAVPVLEGLLAHHDVLAVVTQPDRRVGRGRRRVQAPPVKTLALTHGLCVLQPARLRRDPETVQILRELGADVFVIAAYGQILRPEVLAIPPRGCIGVHASLLPKLRGAAPIAAAILQGLTETGVTLMLTNEGVDTGPILAQRRAAIEPRDTTATLTRRLTQMGADLLIETLPGWLAGAIMPQPQDERQATYAPPIGREDAVINWTRPAVEIDRQIRAYATWPVAFCWCGGQRLLVLRAHPLPSWSGEGEPGTVVQFAEGIGVVTGQGLLVLDEIQLAGKRPMTPEALARGRPDFVCGVLASCSPEER